MSAETYTLGEVNHLVSIAFAAGGYFALNPEAMLKKDVSEDVQYIARFMGICEESGRSMFPGKSLIKDRINAAIFAHFHEAKANQAAESAAKNN